MDRDASIDIAYGEAEMAEFATGRQVPRRESAERACLDRAVTAGLVTFVVFLWAAVLLLVMGWLADLFRAALPWSLLAYLAVASAVSTAISRRNWRVARSCARTDLADR